MKTLDFSSTSAKNILKSKSKMEIHPRVINRRNFRLLERPKRSKFKIVKIPMSLSPTATLSLRIRTSWLICINLQILISSRCISNEGRLVTCWTTRRLISRNLVSINHCKAKWQGIITKCIDLFKWIHRIAHLKQLKWGGVVLDKRVNRLCIKIRRVSRTIWCRPWIYKLRLRSLVRGPPNDELLTIATLAMTLRIG